MQALNLEPQEGNLGSTEEKKQNETKQPLLAVVEEYLEAKNAVSDRMEQELAEVQQMVLKSNQAPKMEQANRFLQAPLPFWSFNSEFMNATIHNLEK